MAKGSAMGIWRGRKGSTVFYYNKNSNNAQKQAMRERTYVISNPQSNSQVSQRLKLLPAQRIQQLLLGVLRRSWQGVEYGGRGLSQFMKAALKMNSGFPYIDKGDDRAIPGEYIISKGTIPQVYTSVEDIDVHTTTLLASGDSPTVGSISTLNIQAGNVEAGDQVTIVVCVTNANDTSEAAAARYRWLYRSFIVDESSTVTLNDLTNNWGFGLTAAANYLAITAENLAASAIIISRQASTPMRSTAQLTVNTNLLEYWFTQTRRNTARRSYQRTAAVGNSNWPVEPGEDGGGTIVPTEDGTYTLSGLTGDKASANGQQARVVIDSETGDPVAVYVKNEELGVLGTGPFLVKENNRVITYTQSQQDYGITPSDLAALASLPTISV